jgi:hypothetical protein
MKGVKNVPPEIHIDIGVVIHASGDTGDWL